jgi:YfiH family protein
VITRLEARVLTSRHGFLGRTGGLSQGIFASLNVGLGSSDDPAAVRANRARALAAVAPGAQLVTLHQVHSAIAVEAGDWADDRRPEADGLVTDRPGVALGILTADCAPLLLEDAAGGIVGACHAGWKGALGGVIGATIDAMERLGARRERIAAAVGPCIGRRSYEVDAAFRARFEAAEAENAAFFADGRPGHAFFDLEGYCLKRLADAGVTRAEGLGADTKPDAARFFSYRRKTLAGEPDYGRQLSVIALPA